MLARTLARLAFTWPDVSAVFPKAMSMWPPISWVGLNSKAVMLNFTPATLSIRAAMMCSEPPTLLIPTLTFLGLRLGVGDQIFERSCKAI